MAGWEQVLNDIRLGRLAGAPLTQTLQVHQPALVSVADELLKWAELRDKGKVTEEEFAAKERERLAKGE